MLDKVRKYSIKSLLTFYLSDENQKSVEFIRSTLFVLIYPVPLFLRFSGLPFTFRNFAEIINYISDLFTVSM